MRESPVERMAQDQAVARPSGAEGETEKPMVVAPVDPITGTSGPRSDAAGNQELRGAVSKVLEVIRPALQADGGDIELRTVDAASGTVEVELTGACVSCPASTVTMKAGVERILRDRVPGVNQVIQVGDGVEDGTFVSF